MAAEAGFELRQNVSADLPLVYLWRPRNIQGVSRRTEGCSLLFDGMLRLGEVRLR